MRTRARSRRSRPRGCTGGRARSGPRASSAEADTRGTHDLLRQILGRAPIRLHHGIVRAVVVVIEPMDVAIPLPVRGLARLDLLQALGRGAALAIGDPSRADGLRGVEIDPIGR